MKTMRNMSKTSKLIVVAVSVVVIAVLTATLSVYAWFANNQNNRLGGVDLSVVGSASVSISVVITDDSGNESSSFSFEDIVPGAKFKVTVKFKNVTSAPISVGLAILDIISIVRPLDDYGVALKTEQFQTISMHNAFALRKEPTSAPTYFVNLDKIMLAEKSALKLPYEYLILPGVTETEEYFYIEFMNAVVDVNGKTITKDNIVDNNGGIIVENARVDINTYQGQMFKIGTLQLLENPKS